VTDVPLSDSLIFFFARSPLYLYKMMEAVLTLVVKCGGDPRPRGVGLSDHALGVMAARSSLSELLVPCREADADAPGEYEYADPAHLGGMDGTYTEVCRVRLRAQGQGGKVKLKGTAEAAEAEQPEGQGQGQGGGPPQPHPHPGAHLRELTPVSIQIRGDSFTPADGDNWELAKLFAASGIYHIIVLFNHVNIHVLSAGPGHARHRHAQQGAVAPPAARAAAPALRHRHHARPRHVLVQCLPARRERPGRAVLLLQLPRPPRPPGLLRQEHRCVSWRGLELTRTALGWILGEMG
jgi:hypothetical protein